MTWAPSDFLRGLYFWWSYGKRPGDFVDDDSTSKTPQEGAEYDLMASAASAPAESEREREKQLYGLFAVILVVVAVLAALLLLRLVPEEEEDAFKGSRVIEAVEGSRALPGLVSVWVEPGVDLNFTLTRANVSCSGNTDCGWGRYVIEVKPGTEKHAIGDLRRTRGVYDAGLVYEDPDATTTDDSEVTP